MCRWLGLLGVGLFIQMPIFAQISFDDRPHVLKKPKIATKEQEDKAKAEELLREARTLYGLAIFRGRNERIIDAMIQLEEAQKLDPQSTAIRRELIPIYITVARDEDALAACQFVLKVDPEDYETAFHQAKILRASGKPKEALAALNQAANSPKAKNRPERLIIILHELGEQHEKNNQFSEAEQVYRRIVALFVDQRDQILLSGDVREDNIAAATAKTFEKIGHCCVQAKKFSKAHDAFRHARNILANQKEPELQQQAVRLNWNLCEMAIAQEKWADALVYLDVYLEQHPVSMEPYERKIVLLRKLQRQAEIIPMLRQYVRGDAHHIGLQLLLAREMSQDPRTQAEAERLYLTLAESYTNPDIYRGLFRLYQSQNRMSEVLNQIDVTMQLATDDKNDQKADQREAAVDRTRSMLQVLREEKKLVEAMLPLALTETRQQRGERGRGLRTYQLLGTLAAQTKQLETAEYFFRECLKRITPFQEAEVYSGLLDVLRQQHKWREIAILCEEALNGARPAQNTNEIILQESLAHAYSELEKHDAALRAIDKAISQAGVEIGKLTLQCQRLMYLANADRFKQALADGELLLKEQILNKDMAQVRITLSNVYTLMRDHENSERQLKLVLEADPNHALANNNLGYQWADRNVYLDDAEKMIRKAIDLDRLVRKDIPNVEPENAAYLDSLGWVLFRQGKLTEAKEWLEKAAALTLGAEDPTVWDHLGDVYFRLKDQANAERAYKMALKLYTNDRRGKKEGRPEEVRRKLQQIKSF